MKRVCFVSREVAGVGGGGIGTYVTEAGSALAAAGCETWLLTADPGPARRDRLASVPGFARVVVVGQGVDPSDRPRFMHGGPAYAHAYLVHRTLQALGVAFDAIEFPDYEAEGLVACQEQRLFASYGEAILAVTLHTPTRDILRLNGLEHRAGHQVRTVAAMEDEAIRIAPDLRSPSRGLAELVGRRLGLAHPVRIVPNPMRLPAEAPPPPAPRATLADLRFLYFGRIEPRKGVAELVEAFRELPDLSLTLIGSDVPMSPYGTSFRDHVRRHASPNVRFEAAMPRQQLLDALPGYDVCLFPSRFENWPYACLEAMAAARVVLGSQAGGMGEMIVEGQSGFLVDACTPAAIVHAVRAKLGSRLGDLDTLGRAAAARSRELADPAAYARTVLAAIDERSARPRAAAGAVQGTRVSIVVPFFEDRDTIDEAVDSALRQTHADLEVLVVDDGSPLPEAGAILDRQARKDRRVRVVRKKNGGLASARNHGIDQARGDYLLFLDADNILHADYAAVAIEVLARFPTAGFVVPQARFFAEGSLRTLEVFNPLPFERATCLLYNSLGDAGGCFRRELFTGSGLRYDESLIAYEDWALWLDLAAAGVRGEIVPRVLYDYRVRPGSMVKATARPNHRALIGLLAARHLPGATAGEIEALTTLFQLWNEAWLEPPLRYKAVDALSRSAARLPWLGRGLRAILGLLARTRRPGAGRT